MVKTYPKRVVFLPGKQRNFIESVKKEKSFSWPELASFLEVHPRTLNDWKREQATMPLDVLKLLLQRTGKRMPQNVEIKDPFWYVHNGGSSAGGLAVYKKYGRIGGDPEHRKKKWYEWWEREGKYKSNLISFCKSIRKPNYSKDLAEFAGIILGDGSIGKTQISITLHSEDDKEYIKFVTGLTKRLFDVYVGTYKRKGVAAVNLNISRSELIRFCTEKIGLKQGNKIKQQVDIPGWIKRNKLYSIACVRGLVDTDGCVFTHRYRVKDKFYEYKKLTFTSYSKPLRESVFNILKNNGLNPRLAQGRDVRLDSVTDMNGYVRVFGFHNSKHLKRYKQ